MRQGWGGGVGLKERVPSELLLGCAVCSLIAISTQPAVNNKGNLQIILRGTDQYSKGTCMASDKIYGTETPFVAAVTGAIFNTVQSVQTEEFLFKFSF